MTMIRNIDKNSEYLPKTIGVEVEAQYNMMDTLRTKLPRMFTSGTRESSAIYECRTAVSNTSNFLDVLLLGEVVRRCLPNYVVGGYDKASGSAHCHAVGFESVLSYEQVEILMIGLMPFMSISYNRNKYDESYYRDALVGISGHGFSTFITRQAKRNFDGYEERGTWIKDQTDRHGSNAVEFRANENSPLWMYLITPILQNAEICKELLAIAESKEFLATIHKTYDGDGSLDMYSEFCDKSLEITIPYLVSKLDDIVKVVRDDQQEYMKAVMLAYLTQDEDEYNRLVNELIEASEETSNMFKAINEKYEEQKDYFHVLKENV